MQGGGAGGWGKGAQGEPGGNTDLCTPWETPPGKHPLGRLPKVEHKSSQESQQFYNLASTQDKRKRKPPRHLYADVEGNRVTLRALNQQQPSQMGVRC